MGSDTPKRPAPNNGGKTAAGAVTKPVSPDDAVLKKPSRRTVPTAKFSPGVHYDPHPATLPPDKR